MHIQINCPKTIRKTTRKENISEFEIQSDAALANATNCLFSFEQRYRADRPADRSVVRPVDHRPEREAKSAWTTCTRASHPV